MVTRLHRLLALASALSPVPAVAQASSDRTETAATTAGTYIPAARPRACGPGRADPIWDTGRAGEIAACLPLPFGQSHAGTAMHAAFVPDAAQAPVAAAAAAARVAGGTFDAAWYLAQYPDVAAAKMDPAAHYQQYGRWEGRLPHAGAKPWRPSSPADYESASACQIKIGTVWAPAGSKQVRVRFKLTRFGDGTPCERSYSIQAGGSNPGGGDPGTVNGVGPMNISGQAQMLAVQEVLSLPSTGSQGELVFNIPATNGYFRAYLQSAEYSPKVLVGFTVVVGGTQPADAQYWPTPLVLPNAPTALPTKLGTPTYATDFLGDFWADGWKAGGASVNSMVGYFARPGTATRSGKPVDAYPIVTDAQGVRVRTIRMTDHRGDPVVVNGKSYEWSTGLIYRTLGNGHFGVRETVLGLHPMSGTDAALWGTSTDGGWPPEFDTVEDFATGQERAYQAWHPRSRAPSLPFAPAVKTSGKHKWTESWDATTYRLWVDGVLVTERPNYAFKEPMDTILSIEGPGGAGGAYDPAQHYDGLRMELYGVKWWQR